MFFLLFILALLGLNPANAGTDEQTTALTTQQTATWLARLDSELKDLKARRSTSSDPRIASLEAEIKALKAQIAALPAGDYASLVVTINALAVRIAAIEEQPTSQYDDSYVLQAIADLQSAPPVTYVTMPLVAVNGFHRMLYVGGGMVFAAPIPNVSTGPVAGRFLGGARLSWDTKADKTTGLTLEGSYELGGWGTRLILSTLSYGPGGSEWGLGLGVAYACNELVDGGCMAQHVGPDLRGSWAVGSRLGLMVTVDLEGNYLEIPDDDGIEVRGVLGAAIRIGNPHPYRVGTMPVAPTAGPDELLPGLESID
ncbi:MAG: hypothetical protein WCT28_03845 [Patescibacteria group bacterium]